MAYCLFLRFSLRFSLSAFCGFTSVTVLLVEQSERTSLVLLAADFLLEKSVHFQSDVYRALIENISADCDNECL